MSLKIAPHVCARPGCNNITRNLKYCCKACASAAQIVNGGEGERECAHCHAIKPGSDFVHVSPGGERRVRSWCRECRGMLSDTAQARRTATIRARAEQRREATTMPTSGKELLVMVDARGRNPAITLDMIDLGGLPGTAVGAYPWPA